MLRKPGLEVSMAQLPGYQGSEKVASIMFDGHSPPSG